MSPKRLFLLITIITAISLYIALPPQTNLNLNQGPVQINQTFYKRPIDFTIFNRRVYFDPQIKLGLDLQGGTHLILEADMEGISPVDRLDALESAKEIITRRIDLFGVSEPLIQTSVNENTDQYRIIIQLPGINDPNQALELIGQTAQMDFREQVEPEEDLEASPSALSVLDSFTPTELTGKDLAKASVDFDSQTSQPVVALRFTKEGAKKFKDITERNIGKPVGIFLDGFPLTLPTVQTAITNGEAVITGGFTTEQAKNLSIQLNAGALPVPIEIISQSNVGATLGQISVQKSLQAGLIGLAMVMIFMALYYGYMGILANIALVIYGIITLALYKIFAITLTLPGLAGFILSVGMAVDANILIFERYKEEIRAGKHWQRAIELGFGRAWDSIKDANVATLTICFILFNPFNWTFLNSSGLVRGFALTLTLGILISLFTGVIVTRTLIRLFFVGKEQK